jgi:hypothetical protein
MADQAEWDNYDRIKHSDREANETRRLADNPATEQAS